MKLKVGDIFRCAECNEPVMCEIDEQDAIDRFEAYFGQEFSEDRAVRVCASCWVILSEYHTTKEVKAKQ